MRRTYAVLSRSKEDIPVRRVWPLIAENFKQQPIEHRAESYRLIAEQARRLDTRLTNEIDRDAMDDLWSFTSSAVVAPAIRSVWTDVERKLPRSRQQSRDAARLLAVEAETIGEALDRAVHRELWPSNPAIAPR